MGRVIPQNVVQSWVEVLSFMQQTVLLSAIRGADGVHKGHRCKALIRWYRRCVVRDAMNGGIISNPWDENGGSFTGPSCWPNEVMRKMDYLSDGAVMGKAVDDFLKSRDDLPLHYYLHAMHAFEILGYKHPDKDIRIFWKEVYMRMVHAFHLWPEKEEQMDRRLGDTEEGWREREDKGGSCET